MQGARGNNVLRQETQQQESLHSIKNTKTASMLEQKEGYLLKKSSKSRFVFTLWQERYFVLTKGKLSIFNSDQDYLNSLLDKNKGSKKFAPSQIIKMSEVNTVCAHYDRDAPKKSKKLFKEADKLEKGRFDLYTAGRVYNLKAKNDDEEVSGDWIEALKESIDYYT